MIEIARGIWKITLGEPEALTPVKLRKQEPLLQGIENLPKKAANSPFIKEQINFKVNQRGCVIELPIEGTEKIYGFGLQLKSFNQTGKKKQMRTNADPVADSGDSHAPVPFYTSTKGYGVLIDTARYVSFYCGSSSKVEKSSTSTYGKERFVARNTEELYTVREHKEEKTMVIEVPSTKGVDIYLFEGPDMKAAVQRYVLFSGGGCIPPIWGLGNWYRGYGRFEDKDVLQLAKELRQRRIPMDVFGLEPGWQSHSYSCSYKWDKERFRNPDEVIEEMDKMNYKLNLWEHVFVHPTSPVYEKLKPYSGDYEVWGGLVPDLNKKEGKTVFANYHKEQLIDKGIMGFKLDECDSSDFTGAWSFPNSAEFPSGLDGEQMHSLLGMFYQETLLSVFKEKNLRTYSSVRSSHALAAPYPFVLYSDLYDHKDFIRGVVNAGFSGLLWSPEVRQCSSEEDLICRIETVVFSPQALVNAWMIPSPPWVQYDIDKNLKGESMENAKEVTDIVRKLFELRMSFIPYLYASFAKYHFEGIPPFRALVMDYPKDERTYNIEDEYIMGDSILVCPVTAAQEGKRKVYLPEGKWFCFWTNKIFQGEQEYELDVPLGRIPLFIKEGSLLPLAKPVEYINPDTMFEITVKCYGKKGEFKLFEDDGMTFDFEKGKYNWISLKASEKKGTTSSRYKVLEWKDIE
jgi:alpha-D-xyloside xylohydrolase